MNARTSKAIRSRIPTCRRLAAPAPDRRHRHHLERNRLLALASCENAGRSRAADRRARPDPDRGGRAASRLFAFVTMAREVVKETTISGRPVEAGNVVLLSFPAANRDPKMFPDADKVVIDRRENRHAAFGLGIHRCVGSNLARMEMQVALEEWLKRISDFRLDPAGTVTWSQGTVRGLASCRFCLERRCRPLPIVRRRPAMDSKQPTRPLSILTSPTPSGGSRQSSSAPSAISSSGTISTPIRRLRSISLPRSSPATTPSSSGSTSPSYSRQPS